MGHHHRPLRERKDTMAVFSVLRPSLQRNMRAATLIITRNSPHEFLVAKNAQKAVSRKVGMFEVSRKMQVMPAKYYANVFYDQAHFFLFLGLAPVLFTVFCANLFVGPAELKDIPEGYEPKEHEYVQGPIQRFFAKYIVVPYHEQYEKNLSVIYDEQKRVEFWQLERKVQQLQNARNDYKGWYFMPGSLDAIKYSETSKVKHESRDLS